MAKTFQRDSGGYAEILKIQCRGAVDALAERIADNVRSQGIRVGDRDGGAHEYDLPVKVASATTDRAKAIVSIPHPSALAVQAKHGTLTKAAAAVGLKVKGKP